MGNWVEFSRWIPDDGNLVVAGVRIPSTVVESWQEWFQKNGIATRIVRKEGGRVLYRWVDDDEREFGGGL